MFQREAHPLVKSSIKRSPRPLSLNPYVLCGVFAYLRAQELDKCVEVSADWEECIDRCWKPGGRLLPQWPRHHRLNIACEVSQCEGVGSPCSVGGIGTSFRR